MHRNHRRTDKNLGKSLRPFQSLFYRMWKGHTQITQDAGKVFCGFEDPVKQLRTYFRSRQIPGMLGGV